MTDRPKPVDLSKFEDDYIFAAQLVDDLITDLKATRKERDQAIELLQEFVDSFLNDEWRPTTIREGVFDTLNESNKLLAELGVE